jgi:hypothetical protein
MSNTNIERGQLRSRRSPMTEQETDMNEEMEAVIEAAVGAVHSYHMSTSSISALAEVGSRTLPEAMEALEQALVAHHDR